MSFLIGFSLQVFNRMKFAQACPTRLHTNDLNTVLHQVSYSDWLFLSYLAKNMEPFVFQRLLSQLAMEYNEKCNGNYKTITRIGKLNGQKSL